ncbi:MAG TPA: phytanoyl-CoA dioxygenase family protein [Fimbriimonadaceae bacterium]
MLELASEILQEPTVPVRAIFFLKSQENNWLVPWHQDVTMASPQKFEREGYRSWTLKEGIWHVQPPDTVLSKMVALRLHLDPCSAHDGPLRVIPATHLAGRLSAEAIDTYVEQTQPAILLADKGEILAMAPLLCHSSGKATGTSQRRVLHVEFCAKSVCPPEIFA